MPITTIDEESPTKLKGLFEGTELQLLESGRLSDCQVSIGSRTWNLHKFIICDRSKYFDRALYGNFVEAADSKVAISEFHMNAKYFNSIIRWLYDGGYPIEVGNVAGSLVEVVKFFVYADYLDIECLYKGLSDSVAKYATELNAEPPTIKAHKDLPSDWVKAMCIFYKTFRGEEKHGLKSALFDLGLQNRKLRKRVFELPKLEELIINVPGFCQDLMLETVRRKL